jgi:hypothetical protein
MRHSLQLWTDSPEGQVEQQDLERIARATFKDLGLGGVVDLTIVPDGQPGHWCIELRGSQGPSKMKIKCGQGSSAQWVRDQIFEQFMA